MIETETIMPCRRRMVLRPMSTTILQYKEQNPIVDTDDCLLVSLL